MADRRLFRLRTPTLRARCRREAAGFSRRSTGSTPRFSASRRAKRSRWTRSSGCCSKSPGKRWRTPASRPRALSGSGDRRLCRDMQLRLRATALLQSRPAIRSIAYLASGNAPSVAAGRLVLRLGLARALHGHRHGLLVVPGRRCMLACQSLRSGESALALARRRQCDLLAETHRSHCPRRTCWRPTADARRSTRAPTASFAARDAESSC